MKYIFVALGLLISIGYVAICVYNLDKMVFEKKSIEVKTKTINSQMQELELNYKNVNSKLQQSNSDKEKVLKEKEELDKKRIELEKQLQAKKDNQNKIAKASESVINAATGTKVAAASPVSSIESMIIEAASKYGVSSSMMLRLAQCESTMGKNLRNSSPVIVNGVNYGHAEGIFQFIPSTWERMSSDAGFEGASVYDSYSNINVAAHAFSTGKKGEWECK